MVAALTGHRPHKFNNDYDLVSPLILRIKELLIRVIRRQGVHMGITGMALGMDQLWAYACIECHVPFIAAIPCSDQPNMWPKKSQGKYYRLLDQAAEVVNVSGKVKYQPEYMQERNIWMVDKVKLEQGKMICVWDGTKGGTANCTAYAIRTLGKQNIIRINPATVQVP